MRVKTSITLPNALLGRLDRVNKNRSALLQKSALTHYVGSLTPAALRELHGALAVSLGLEE
ncbi:MAG TPA: hypothetical protein VNY05_30700 [Candidatus Acidoferrales bacterium]|nr:hypothetical protein [Candidatus Acidoferrales bacterium]